MTPHYWQELGLAALLLVGLLLAMLWMVAEFAYTVFVLTVKGRAMKRLIDLASNFLSGKKTYAAGVGLIGLGVVRIYLGDPMGGAESIGLGLTAIFGRQAVAKLAAPLAPAQISPPRQPWETLRK